MPKALSDLAYSLRVLGRRWPMTVACLLVVAVAVGANVVVWTTAANVLLAPLPFREPAQLVRLYEGNPAKELPRFSVSPGTFAYWRDHARSLSGIACYYRSGRDSYLRLADEDVPVVAAFISPSFTDVLGLRLAAGSPLAEEHDGTTALISLSLWDRAFNRSPAVVGRTVLQEGRSLTISGVLSEESHLLPGVDVYLAIRFRHQVGIRERGTRYLQVVARLDPGVTLEQAGTELDLLSVRLAELYPATNDGWGAVALDLKEALSEGVRPALLALGAAVVLILLLTCFNLANVFLARSSERGEELFVRAALGAGAARLATLLLTETVVLAIGGGLIGLFPTYWSLPLIAQSLQLGQLGVASFSGMPAAAALLLSLLVGIGIGLYPALRAIGGRWTSSMEGSRRFSVSRLGFQRIMGALQIAAAVALLGSTGLLLYGIGLILTKDPGFDAANRYALEIRLPAGQAAGIGAPMVESLLDEVRSIPGVVETAGTSSLPLTGTRITNFMSLPAGIEAQRWAVGFNVVTASYFQAMGIAVLDGRGFQGEDPERPVAVVSASIANRFWPGRSAIGQTVSLEPDRYETREVVGVVEDVNTLSLQGPGEFEAYVPFAQSPIRFLTLVIRSQGQERLSLADFKGRIQRMDPAVGVFNLRPVARVVDESWKEARLVASLLGSLTAMAVLLALVGVYAITRIGVRKRALEFAVRLAIGGSPRSLRRLVLRETITTAAIGTAMGLSLAALGSRLWGRIELQMQSPNPGVLAVVAVVMISAALLSAYLPAFAASRREPSAILKHI